MSSTWTFQQQMGLSRQMIAQLLCWWWQYDDEHMMMTNKKELKQKSKKNQDFSADV